MKRRFDEIIQNCTSSENYKLTFGNLYLRYTFMNLYESDTIIHKKYNLHFTLTIYIDGL